MILTVTIPDTLQPYLDAAAVASGQSDLSAAVVAHLAALIRDSARRGLTDQAMRAVADQVTQALTAVDEQNGLITVETSADPVTAP